MKELNPAYVSHVNRLINDSPYFRLLSMKIVDVGFFKFDLPEFSRPGRIAQIEKKMRRLKYLYQLAKGV